MKQLSFLMFCFLITSMQHFVMAAGPVNGTIYFSKQRFGNSNANAGSSFSSNEFIYGRLELQGGSLRDVFGIKTTEKEPFPYIISKWRVLQNGKEMYYSNTDRNYILLNDADLDGNSINFDVLPDPAKVNTLYSMLTDFSAGNGFIPIYSLIDEQHFPKGGVYQIEVVLYSKPINAWGREEEDPEKWPEVVGVFDLNFREADIATLEKNRKLSVENARENAFRYDKMPDIFSKGAVINDPKANNAKILSIVKRDLPRRTILKMAIEKDATTNWHIAKDDYNLPKYRYFNQTVWVAYKEDGKCYIGTVSLRETYTGGGTYGPLQVAFTSDGSKPDRGIDCAKVK